MLPSASWSFPPRPTSLVTGCMKLHTRLWKATSIPIVRMPSITRRPPSPSTAAAFIDMSRGETEERYWDGTARSCCAVTTLAW